MNLEDYGPLHNIGKMKIVEKNTGYNDYDRIEEDRSILVETMEDMGLPMDIAEGIADDIADAADDTKEGYVIYDAGLSVEEGVTKNKGLTPGEQEERMERLTAEYLDAGEDGDRYATAIDLDDEDDDRRQETIDENLVSEVDGVEVYDNTPPWEADSTENEDFEDKDAEEVADDLLKSVDEKDREDAEDAADCEELRREGYLDDADTGGVEDIEASQFPETYSDGESELGPVSGMTQLQIGNSLEALVSLEEKDKLMTAEQKETLDDMIDDLVYAEEIDFEAANTPSEAAA